MGLDLKLLPFISPRDDSAHTILDCERWSAFTDAVLAIEARHGRDVPDTFMSYLSREDDRDSHYGLTINTPYGEPLKYVRAKHLLTLPPDLLDNHTNRAVWAYLAQLPPDWPVALYWC